MTRAASRHLIAWWLGRALPPGTVAGALGDLDEEFITRAATVGRVRAEWWMVREALSVVRAYRQVRRVEARPRLALVRDLGDGLVESLRHMRRAPGYALMATGSLGVAIAAIISTAGITDTILRQPIARSQAERVHRLSSAITSGQSQAFSFPELEAVGAALSGSAQIGAVALTPALMRVDDASAQDLIDVSVGAVHDVLGVSAVRGRLLTRDDDRPGRPRVLVVSEAFWREKLFASDTAVGRVVVINGLDYTVVGVAPTVPSLGFFGVSAAGWVPAATADSLLTRGWRTDPTNRAFVALLKTDTPRLSPEVDGRLVTAATDLARVFPERWRDRRLLATEGLLVTGNLRRTSTLIASLLSVMAALLLVVAATNVGGLVFAQASTRRRAIAIKAALGARRATLVMGTLAEGALLGVFAGLIALALYGWFAQLAQSIDILPTVTLRLELPWTWRVAGLTALLSVTAGVVTTLMPALSVSRLASTRSLDALSSRQSSDMTTGRARRWLLGAQVAATVVLVVSATLFTRSLGAIGGTSVGIDIDRLAAFDFDIEPTAVPPEALPALARSALDRVRALPAVAGVAMASRAPVDQSTPAGDVRAIIHSAEAVLRDVTRLEVTVEYFNTVGLRRLDGRLFTPADASRPVAVINDTLARRLQGATAFTDLGSGMSYQVIGVVSNAKYRTLNEPAQPHFYSAVAPRFHMAMLVRAHGDPAALFADVQRTLDLTGPGVQGFFPRTGRDHLRPILLPALVSAGVARSLGMLAWGLASIGLFGLLSWLVQSRRQEWGLRMAIGASPMDVRRLVIRHAWQAAWPGTLVGLAATTVVVWFARGQIFGLTVLDPVVLTIVPALIGGIVLVASWLPAQRATRISVTELLR